MASRIRNPDWQEDAELKQDLKRYILQNLSRREILDFVSRDYAQHAWSLGAFELLAGDWHILISSTLSTIPT